MEEIKTILWKDEKIDLSLLPMEDLNKILSQLKRNEKKIKREINTIIEELA